MPALNLFVDAALTTPATLPLAFTQDVLGAIAPHRRPLYLGSTDADLKFQADSDPGVDQIVLSISDSAPASGQPATAIKLATTELGLDAAVGGASLDLGTQILSGVANALPIWIEFDDSSAVVAVDGTLKIALNTLRVTAV